MSTTKTTDRIVRKSTTATRSAVLLRMDATAVILVVVVVVVVVVSSVLAVVAGAGVAVSPHEVSFSQLHDERQRKHQQYYHRSELIDDSDMMGINHNIISALPYEYIDPKLLPESFSWDNVYGGKSFLTRALNQHLPQYCGSCWAHASVSALADRIKIARNGTSDEINLSIQYILNCATKAVGTCNGGSMIKMYQFIQQQSGFIPYDTCQPYIACSYDSTEGFCPYVDTTCTPINTCRTCNTFVENGGYCTEIDVIPNATIAEFGSYEVQQQSDPSTNNGDGSIVPMVKAEIFARGPVGTGLNGAGLADYVGGIISDVTASRNHTHAVSITGWGKDSTTGQEYWIVRNSWGQYWGEMGFFRIEMHKDILGIEQKVVWATPGSFTTINYPCFEDGKNCGPVTHTYIDPSNDIPAVQNRLQQAALYSQTPVQDST